MEMEELVYELRDVGEKCSIELPCDSDEDNLWIVGLTVASELSSTIAERFAESDVVIGLFHIQGREDGHWVTPHIDLPLILNDESLDTPMLLSHGSILMVGGHIFTYLIHESATTTNNPTSDSPIQTTVVGNTMPPPKPKRHQRGSVMTEEVLSRSQKFQLDKCDTIMGVVSIDLNAPPPEAPKLRITHDKERPERNLEQSTELFMSIRDSVVNNDIELLNHIDNPEQMVNVCVSYLLQFCVSHSLTLTAKDTDTFYQAVTTVCLHGTTLFFDFLSGMKQKKVITEQDTVPFLTMFNNVLLICMDEEESTLVCLRILTHFSQDPQQIGTLTKLKSPSLVYASMSVYTDYVQIQLLALRFIENLSYHSAQLQSGGGVSPVKEAGLDLILQTIDKHSNEKLLLLTGLRVFSNVLRFETTSTNIYELVKDPSETPSTNTTVYEYMMSKALPAVMDIYQNHKDNKEISELCLELMEYYVNQDEEDTTTTKSGSNPQMQSTTSVDAAPIPDKYTRTRPSETTQLQDNVDQNIDSDGRNLEDFENDIPGYGTHIEPDVNGGTSLYDELNEAETHTSDTLENEQGCDPHRQVVIGDVDAIYSTVNKPKRSASNTQNQKPTNTVKPNNAKVHRNSIEDSDSDIEGPELDYETRKRLNNLPVSKQAKNESSYVDMTRTDTLRNQPKQPAEDEDEFDIPKQTNNLPKKLGKYFKKLKPRRKQKFTLPHDLDASLTYTQFETCDSDFEIVQEDMDKTMNSKHASISGHLTGTPALVKIPQENVEPIVEPTIKSEYVDQEEIEDDYEDLQNFEDIPQKSNANSTEDPIYDLAGPLDQTPYSTGENKTISENLDLNGKDKPTDATLPRDTSSADSFDEFIPAKEEWDKRSRTSEDEFIDNATQGMVPNLPQAATNHMTDGSSLYAGSEMGSTYTLESLPESTIEPGANERYIGEIEDEETPELDSKWSPQQSALDYQTLKRTADKPKSKKSAWVSALKQIYEKPQKKLARSMSRSQSWSNLGPTQNNNNNKGVVENPLYGSPMKKAVSTMSLDGGGKKSSKRFRWRRKKSKDTIALPTECSPGVIPEENEELTASSQMKNSTSAQKSGQKPFDPDMPFRRNEFATVKSKQKKKTKMPWHNSSGSEFKH